MTTRRIRREPEYLEQRTLFYWASLHGERIPELRWLYAVPNGRGRTKTEAKKLKAEGVKRGVLDVHLDVARLGAHGLRIEMKAPGKLRETSAEQDEWRAHHQAEGYLAVVCDSWQAAWNLLMDYLGHPELRQPLPVR